MKVILLQDVAKIGRRFDVVTVPDGYGLNKLIPQGMAKPATQENLKAVQAQSATNEAAKAQADEAFTAIVAKVKDVSLEVAVEANEQGHLFQALKAEAVAQEVETKTGVPIRADQVHIKTPIKEVGEHHVGLTSGNTEEFVTVTVVAK
tara:strand:- start:1668 stop:2111 length:444 start_codon:yes stop_codon:yes gene_type:complete